MKNNLLIIRKPELLNEIDYGKHVDINVNMLTCGSHMKIWWLCKEYAHSFEMSIADRVKGHGCPYCAGKRVLKGFNDLASQRPDLLKEWNWNENNKRGIYPDCIIHKSNRKIWWHCNTCNGSYEMKLASKTLKHPQGCPYCAGKRVLTGYNDLLTQYPELVDSSWDYVNNDAHKVYPDRITSGSNIKAWWRCDKHHSFRMSAKDRVKGHGCPYCSGKLVLAGFNDLQSNYPELMSEWDYVNNNDKNIHPDEITAGSHVEAYWKCSEYMHSYKMTVNDKINNTGCPFCTGRKVLRGFNDLASQHPELIESEWDYELNNNLGLAPDDITCGSGVRAYWKCSHGHHWRASIYKRVNGSKCPHCSHRISNQENQVADYISNYLCSHYDDIAYTMHGSIKFKRIYEMKKLDPDTVLSDGLQQHLLKEIDIYIPELRLAVEYDGDYWHDDEVMLNSRGMTNDESHAIKQALCSHACIKLLFISEHDWLSDADNVSKIIMRALNEVIFNAVK